MVASLQKDLNGLATACADVDNRDLCKDLTGISEEFKLMSSRGIWEGFLCLPRTGDASSL